MEDYWIKNVYAAVRDISDLKLQKETWLGNADNRVSSFDEMINTLYDDNCFEDFLAVNEWNKQNSLGDLHQELLSLGEMIDAFEEPASDAQILTDAGWKKITEQAKRAIKVWDHSALSIYQAT